MTRKEFIRNTAISTTSMVTLPGSSFSAVKSSKHDYSGAFGMARSIISERTYSPQIEGTIPAGIKGTLYRNGPGLFEKDGYRKSNILDGDGMVQAFRFTEGKVEYRNRFTQTNKWLEEKDAGKYLYRTWTTRRPGGALKNAFMQGEFGNQAGVTVRVINGRLFAFDESNLPYELNPETLETLGDTDFGVHFENINTLFAAHSKVDPLTGEWIQFGLENGPKSVIQLSIFDKSIKLLRSKRYELPVGTYMHDFFVTRNYIVFNLQPAEMNPLSFIMGFDSFAESLRWKASRGSTFMVVDRTLKNTPQYFTTDSVFMWHSLNAFEKGNEIISYFSGYDEPDHFIGDHAQTYAIMKPGAHPENLPAPAHPGTVRIVRIDLNTGKIRMEAIAHDDGYSYEFPVMDERYLTNEHSIGFFARGTLNGAFHHEIARIDLSTGKVTAFDFGHGSYVGEPIFVPRNEASLADSAADSGWLMTLVFDDSTDKSYVAILDTDDLHNGPVAKVHLDHHSPMSFHGTWSPA